MSEILTQANCSFVQERGLTAAKTILLLGGARGTVNSFAQIQLAVSTTAL